MPYCDNELTILQNIVWKGRGVYNRSSILNCFDSPTWLQHTNIETLFVCLEFEGPITVSVLDHVDRGVVHKLATRSACSADSYMKIDIDLNNVIGLISIDITLHGNATIQNAYFATRTPKANPDTLVQYTVCTFKREEYVTKNMEVFESYVRENNMLGRARLTVIDNGSSLPERNDEVINIIPNDNMGGTGGFTRGIFEVLHGRFKDDGISHIVLMDDDIKLSEENFIRNQAFLAHANPGVHLGAAMHGIVPGAESRPRVGCFGHIHKGTLHPSDIAIGHNQSPELVYTGLRNRDRQPETTGWWWHCFPVEAAKKIHLSFPFFIKMDDIDYSFRITKAGYKLVIPLSFWVEHDDFDVKYSAMMQYYRFRNRWVLMALESKMPDYREFVRFYIGAVIAFLSRYHYEHAQLLVDALKDFMKGPDYIVENYSEILTAVIRRVKTEKAAMITPAEVAASRPSPYAKVRRESGMRRWRRRLSFNGLFFPARGDVLVDKRENPGAKGWYRAKSIFFFDSAKGSGYRVERDFLRHHSILMQALSVCLRLRFQYERTCEEYVSNYDKYTSAGFWKQYFHIKGGDDA